MCRFNLESLETEACALLTVGSLDTPSGKHLLWVESPGWGDTSAVNEGRMLERFLTRLGGLSADELALPLT